MSNFSIRIEIFKEGEEYVALSPELNVSSFGETIEEAKLAIKEAIEAFMEECEKMGTLDGVLEEAGFKRNMVSKAPIVIKTSPRLVPVAHIRTNMTTAGMSRDHYFELLGKYGQNNCINPLLLSGGMDTRRLKTRTVTSTGIYR